MVYHNNYLKEDLFKNWWWDGLIKHLKQKLHNTAQCKTSTIFKSSFTHKYCINHFSIIFTSIKTKLYFTTKLISYTSRSYCSSNGPSVAVTMSLANGLVGTGFATQYRLQPRVGF